MEVDLADAGLSGQRRLGDGLFLVEFCQKLRNALVGKELPVVVDVGVDVGFLHQFFIQIVGGFAFHTLYLLYFPVERRYIMY